ncbi:hypothetical protein EYF80_053251 [Liparis tanakae]|uniref:Uncharacterized protein n=1 Tax=Liparis tanakae TaxID=230148 RepID=A0A4Z2F734_9TELE|nr:hypothetical protein EYF80_053251 [Liparis tanakae]
MRLDSVSARYTSTASCCRSTGRSSFTREEQEEQQQEGERSCRPERHGGLKETRSQLAPRGGVSDKEQLQPGGRS